MIISNISRTFRSRTNASRLFQPPQKSARRLDAITTATAADDLRQRFDLVHPVGLCRAAIGDMTENVMRRTIGRYTPARRAADATAVISVENKGASKVFLLILPSNRHRRNLHECLRFRIKSLVRITPVWYRWFQLCQYSKLLGTHYGRSLVSSGPGAGQRDAGGPRASPSAGAVSGLPHDEGRAPNEAVGDRANRRLSRRAAGGSVAPCRRGHGTAAGWADAARPGSSALDGVFVRGTRGAGTRRRSDPDSQCGARRPRSRDVSRRRPDRVHAAPCQSRRR